MSMAYFISGQNSVTLVSMLFTPALSLSYLSTNFLVKNVLSTFFMSFLTLPVIIASSEHGSQYMVLFVVVSL